MENEFGSNILSAAGGVVLADPNSVACQAFRQAVTKWCNTDPNERDGSFNDYMFRELKSGTPPVPGGKALAEQIEREVPMLADQQTMKTLADRAKNALDRAKNVPTKANKSRAQQYSDVLDEVTDLTDKFKSGSLSDNSYRRLVNGQMKGLGHYQMRYPDGMFQGHPVEIKGPKDEWGKKVSPRSKADQKGDYQKVRKDGKVIEVSCKSCGGDCEEGNQCPKKKK